MTEHYRVSDTAFEVMYQMPSLPERWLAHGRVLARPLLPRHLWGNTRAETHQKRVEYIEAEDEAFDAELAQHGLSWQPGSHIPDLAYHARILKSWERILNIDEVDPNRYWTKPTKAEKDIQGTFWSLSLNQVRKATPFIGHGKPLTPLLL